MKKHDELKKSLDELTELLDQSAENSEQSAELKLKAREVLDSLGEDDASAETKSGSIKKKHEKRHVKDKEHSYDELIANTILNNIDPGSSHAFVFIKTLDDIDKKSMNEAVEFTRRGYKGPECTADDIIAVANTVPSKYFLEGMVFTRNGVFWGYQNNIYYIEYKDVESVVLPESESSSRFGDDIMHIERYANDEITIPFDRTLYDDYRAIGDTLIELNKIAENLPVN